MYIQEHTGAPETVIAAALESVEFRKAPDVETAMTAAAKAAERMFKNNLTAKVQRELGAAVELFELDNGEWASDMDVSAGLDAKTEYESAMDDVAEAYVEPFVEVLSATWLGTNTIDSQIWLPQQAGVAAFATSLAKEAFKQLADAKTPAQLLASAGVTRPMIEAAVAAYEPPKKGNKVTATPTEAPDELDIVVSKIFAYVGKDHDALEVYDDIETVLTEDDELLALSAGERIGIKQDDIDVLQMKALDMEDATAEVYALVKAKGTKTLPPRRVAGPPAEVPEGAGASVLVALKDCGAPDTATAEALGVSRTTYTNWIKGKGEFAPDTEQAAYLREALVTKLNALGAALAVLDGTDYEAIE